MTDFVSYTVAIVSWLAAVLSISIGNSLLIETGVLPANHTFLELLWILTVAVQALFLFNYYDSVSKAVKQHFVVNSLLFLGWHWVVKYNLRAVGLLASVLLLVSSATCYIRQHTYNVTPVRDWFVIHWAVSALPLVISFYLTVVQTWSVFDLPKKIFGLNASNTLLVIHFIIISALLIWFADWGTGLIGGGLATSIGLHVKKHNTGYYGEVTGLILLLASVYTAYYRPQKSVNLGSADQAPLLG